MFMIDRVIMFPLLFKFNLKGSVSSSMACLHVPSLVAHCCRHFHSLHASPIVSFGLKFPVKLNSFSGLYFHGP